MRLAAIELEEFRGWVEPIRIELDAAVVIVYGPNGTGKTSLFDAVLWALTGEIPRLGEDHKTDVISRYGASGNARVRLELSTGTGATLALTRNANGNASRLQVESDGVTYSDEEASLALTRKLWPDGVGSSGAGGIASVFARAVYLQQDDVRRFIEADSDADRFSAVAELVGVGRYTELQSQLERERVVWSRQTNELRGEATELEQRAAQMQAQIADLSRDATTVTGWTRWRESALKVVPDATFIPTDETASQAGEAVDRTIRRLDEELRARQRSADRASTARRDLRTAQAVQAPSPEDLSAARVAATLGAAQVAQLQKQLAQAEHEAAAERERLLLERDSERELGTLAALALRHLDWKCPVCSQT